MLSFPFDNRIVEDPTQWAPWMALAGSGLIQMPDGKAKAAGIALIAAGDNKCSISL